MKVDIETVDIKTASFEIWTPEEPGDLKAVTVLTPGSNGDGRGDVYRRVWQTFARENRTALVGCCFEDQESSVAEGYANASGESGPCLLQAINYFSQKLEGLENLRNLPLLLWGFSAGGQFNYEFNAWFPDRVAGFIANKGGIYYTALCQPAARENPGLFFVGTHDADWRKDIVRGLVGLNRRMKANWELIEENCAHEYGDSQEKAINFFQEILKKR